MPTTEVNLLVLSKINVKKIIEKMPKEMESFVTLAKQRIRHHQDLIIRSLQKDRDAFKILQTTQRAEEVDPKAPSQFVVKLLRNHIESKTNMTSFEEKILRLISRSPVAESDSEEGIMVEAEMAKTPVTSEAEVSEEEESEESEGSKKMSSVSGRVCKLIRQFLSVVLIIFA
jgi:hypothetical protein